MSDDSSQESGVTKASVESSKPGTMGSSADAETRAIYAESLEHDAAGKAEYFIRYMPRDIDQPGKVIVDLGSLTGKMINILAGKYPNAQCKGIEGDPLYVLEARAREDNEPNVEFIQGDIAQIDLPSADVFTASAVLHEVYSHTVGEEFSFVPVIRALGKMREALREGGKVIIREAAMPENPNEPMQIRFNDIVDMASPSRDGKKKTVTHSDPELSKKDPATCTNFALFKRFVEEFELFKLPRYVGLQRELLEQIGKSSPEDAMHSINAPAWVIGEFLRKRTFTQTPEMWRQEMKEQNAPFTREMLVDMAIQAGFDPEKILAKSVYEDHFYAQITPQTGIEIRDAEGEIIDQSKRFPSHVYATLEK